MADDPELTPGKKAADCASEITKRYSFSMACLAFAFIARAAGPADRAAATPPAG